MLKLGKKSSVDLLSGDEGWVIFKFSVPIILSYLLQQIYTISDAAICGQTLGVDDIAGVNDVFPILFIFLQFAVGCTAGFSVITSIAAGRGDQARVRRSFAAQLLLGLGAQGGEQTQGQKDQRHHDEGQRQRQPVHAGCLELD